MSTAPAEVERPEADVRPDHPWVTIVWDDPVNLMDYVTHVFQKLFGYPKAKAEKLMLQVHHEGRAAVSSGTGSRWRTTFSACTPTAFGPPCKRTTERWLSLAKVSRRARGPRMQLRDDEVLVISHLLGELDGLLGGGEPPAEAAPDGTDTDDDVIAGLNCSTEPVNAPSDPALLRLLPDAYPDDAEATEEFRRYTDATLRDGMHADLLAVRESLLVIGENGQASLDDDLAQAGCGC